MKNLQEQTKEILNFYGLKANKSLGQNFLVDEVALQGIISSSDLSKSDLVIEIGPGLGTLTQELIKSAGKVICIELDENMVNILNHRFLGIKNLKVIEGDVLKLDLHEIIKEEKGNLKQVKIIANLPYYITTPIIMKLLEDRLEIQSITVMVQKEVAERLAAKPGDKLCGAITVATNYYTFTEIVLEVPKESFYPIPEVDSSVISLRVLEKPTICVEDKELLFRIVKISFQNRRKTLLNNLCSAKIIDGKEKTKEMLENLDIDPNRRGETLTLQEYEKIVNYLKDN